MNWGFLIMACLSFAYVCQELAQHGEKKTGTHNGITGLLSAAIQMVIVYWAMGWHF